MTATLTDTRRLHGWGGTAPTVARVVSPRNLEATHAALASSPFSSAARGVVPRGSGCSYGDAATNAGGTVLDMAGLDTVGPVDDARGQVTVGGGATLRAVLDAIRPRGWTLPVVPGTARVTVGGAIAADVHGKNHPHVGSFGQHVRRIVLVTPHAVEAHAPDEDPEVFWATVGGMGLTGVIAEATLDLVRSGSNAVRTGLVRTTGLDDTITRLETAGRAHHGAAAWLDLLTRSDTGRGVVEWYDPVDDAVPAHGSPPTSASRIAGADRVPSAPRLPTNVVRPAAVRALNALRWRRAPATEQHAVRDHDTATFPLDAIKDWNRLYGPRGFVQHQSVVPPDRVDVLQRMVATVRDRRVPVTLAVLKRLGESSPGHLSFPAPGWTLAIDIPAEVQALPPLLDRFDAWVADAGGRIYLAKDARMSPPLLRRMYPRLDEWRTVRDRLDPERVMTSDLGRRLGVIDDA